MRKRRYDFSVKDYIKTCIPFVPSKAKKQFNTLTDKLNSETDLPSILRELRKMKLAMRLLLQTHTRMLMNFDQSTNIDTKMEDSTNIEFDEFPK